MYVRPASLEAALSAVAVPGARVLSGGTDFYPTNGLRPITSPIVDISAVGELRSITSGAGGVRFGARATWSDIVAASLPSSFDGLKAAAREVGSLQIQNAGTIAGNLCNASPAADGVPPLLALDAEVELQSAAGGTRSLPLSRFITGYRQTALRPGEIVTAVTVPRPIGGRSTFGKLGSRRYLVISIAMVAVNIVVDGDGIVSDIRVAVGACSAVAQRLSQVEQALRGKPARPGISAVVTPSQLAGLTPIDDVRATAKYRVDAGLTLVRRTIDATVTGV